MTRDNSDDIDIVHKTVTKQVINDRFCRFRFQKTQPNW